MKSSVLLFFLLLYFIYLSKCQVSPPSCKPQWFIVPTPDNKSCICMDGCYNITSSLNSNGDCKNCSSICLTCVGSSTTCTSCNSSNYLSLSGTTCVCQDGFVNKTNLSVVNCVPCYYSCLTCFDTSFSSCISCNISTRIKDGSQCLCKNGTYDDLNSESCSPCHPTCLWCVGESSFQCTNCDSNLLRYMETNNSGFCLCNDGYYDSFVPLCQKCGISCLTCSVNANRCTSCESDNFRNLSGISCNCISHYYDVGQAACLICSIRCGDCINNATTCLTCSNILRMHVNTTCPCIDGYYQNPMTIDCQPCTNFCATCVNSSSTCLSCYNHGNRELYNATCSCSFGYYDNNSIDCQLCPYQCVTCIGPSPPVCTSCSETSYRQLQNGQCLCKKGFYDNGALICLPCDSICQTCQSSASICTSCDSAQHRQLFAQSCSCITTYYSDNNKTCQPCYYTCLNCFGGNSNNCYTCQLNRDYINYSCPCFDGMYEAHQFCYQCDPICKTCITNSTHCTSCPISRALSNGTCVCASGYYASGLDCPQCSLECLNCISSSTQCTSCNISQLTVFISSTCVCQTGYYKNFSTYICMKCHYSCINCTSSNDSNNCISCNSSLNRLLASSGSCQCTIHYFDDGKPMCTACNSSCYSCVGPSDFNCTSCVADYLLIGSYCKRNLSCNNYLYNNQCIDICPNSTFGIINTSQGNICFPCNNGCKTCLSDTHCTSCLTGHFFNTSSYSCQLLCPLGYYINSKSNCTQCPTECLQCVMNQTLDIICNTCKQGYFLKDGGSCARTCKNGYILVGTLCHHCTRNCITCSNITNNGCSVCDFQYSILNGACFSICPIGYISTSNTNSTSYCQPCPQTCAVCMNNTCLQCSIGYYRTLSGDCLVQGYFVDKIGNIHSCHPNCKSCTNTSFSSCILCNNSRGDHGQLAISGYCDCWVGSVDTGDGGCSIQAYKDVLSSTQTLIGATQSVAYLVTMVSIISGNCIPLIGFGSYLQTYSSFYYLNSSSVMQTNIVLQSYYKINPISYYRSFSNLTNITNMRRMLISTQTDESLYFRGQPWHYLIEWAFPAFIINLLIWCITLFSFCFNYCFCSKSSVSNQFIFNELVSSSEYRQKKIEKTEKIEKRQKKKEHQKPQQKQDKLMELQQKQDINLKKCCHACLKYPYKYYIQQFLRKYHEAVAIIFFMLTYLQITMYAAFSVQNYYQMEMYEPNFNTNYVNVALSFVIIVYYAGYLLRIFIGIFILHLIKSSKSSLRILFHMFRKNAISRLNKMFLPLLIIRNTCIALFISLLSFNPFYQCISCLSLIIFSMIFNFFICPYQKATRIFFHITQLLFVIQISLMTYMTVLPEQSRVTPSKILIFLNFLQLVLVVLLASWIVLTITSITQCFRNKIHNRERRMDEKKKLENQQSLSHIKHDQQIEQNANNQNGIDCDKSYEQDNKQLDNSQLDHLVDSMESVQTKKMASFRIVSDNENEKKISSSKDAATNTPRKYMAD